MSTATATGSIPPRGASGVSRFVIALAVAGTILLALGAFWLSFTTLRDLAVLSGVPEEQAWIWPLIVDGVILEATISVVALRNSAPSARRFAWLLLAAGAGVSVAANITHAIVAADTRVPATIAALVASVPPLVLLAMTHLTVELTRNSSPATEPPEAAPELARELSETGALTQKRDSSDAAQPATVSASDRVPALTSRTLPANGAVVALESVERGDARARAVTLNAAGVSKRQIAASLGVHPTTVGRWVNTPDRQQDGVPHD